MAFAAANQQDFRHGPAAQTEQEKMTSLLNVESASNLLSVQ